MVGKRVHIGRNSSTKCSSTISLKTTNNGQGVSHSNIGWTNKEMSWIKINSGENKQFRLINWDKNLAVKCKNATKRFNTDTKN